MSLTRREILEQLTRLGVRTLEGLKKSCREYEAYWFAVQQIPSVSDQNDSYLQEL